MSSDDPPDAVVAWAVAVTVVVRVDVTCGVCKVAVALMGSVGLIPGGCEVWTAAVPVAGATVAPVGLAVGALISVGGAGVGDMGAVG